MKSHTMTLKIQLKPGTPSSPSVKRLALSMRIRLADSATTNRPTQSPRWASSSPSSLYVNSSISTMRPSPSYQRSTRMISIFLFYGAAQMAMNLQRSSPSYLLSMGWWRLTTSNSINFCASCGSWPPDTSASLTIIRRTLPTSAKLSTTS